MSSKKKPVASEEMLVGGKGCLVLAHGNEVRVEECNGEGVESLSPAPQRTDSTRQARARAGIR